MKDKIWIIISILLTIGITIIGTLYYVQTTSQNATMTPSVKEEKEVPIYTETDVKEKIKYNQDRDAIKEHWQMLITANYSGGQQLGMRGGFKDVRISVINTTNYTIDKAFVMVNISKGLFGQKPCHTGVLDFDNIPPHDSVTTLFSHLECGQKMETQLIRFYCKALNLKVQPQ